MNEKKAIKILREAKMLLNNAGFNKVCLAQGTLLGAYREKKFIGIDDDIDLILVELEIDTFKQLRDIFIKNEFEVREHIDNKFIAVFKNGIPVDIQMGYYIGEYFVVESGWTIDKYPKNLFENLVTIRFYDDEYFAPSPIEEYLYQRYGKNWGIPKVVKFRDSVMKIAWKPGFEHKQNK